MRFYLVRSVAAKIPMLATEQIITQSLGTTEVATIVAARQWKKETGGTR